MPEPVYFILFFPLPPLELGGVFKICSVCLVFSFGRFAQEDAVDIIIIIRKK